MIDRRTTMVRGIRRVLGVIALLGVIGCNASAGPSVAPVTTASEAATVPPSASHEASAPHLTYVALGNSLLFAAEEDCDGCTSAAVIYGQRMQDDLGIPVEVHNLTMHNSLTSPGLLSYLTDGARIGREPEDVFDAVSAADVVSVTIGFNDFGSVDPTQHRARMDAYERDLDGILDRIDILRAGKPTAVRVTQQFNNGGSIWTTTVEAMNEIVCRVAAAHDAICVDVYHPFNGADGSADPAARGYFGADGTHPSQLGMEVIADALAATGYAPVR